MPNCSAPGADLSATVKDLTAALAAATAGAAPPGAAGPPPCAATRVEPVPYGEIPFDRSRLDVLRDLLAKLEAQGFRGVVKITSLRRDFLSQRQCRGRIRARRRRICPPASAI